MTTELLDRQGDPSPITHDPCCSTHGEPMTCERYRRTHFVEVRPCCQHDAALLDNQALSADAESLDRQGDPANGRIVVRCDDPRCRDFVCTGCNQALRLVRTAYGARATCGCTDIRWTAIRERDERVAAPWVAERR